MDIEELKKRFCNPYWRKGLINILPNLRNQDKLQGKCDNYKFKYSCGGCKARAYGYTVNLAATPGCIRNKKENKLFTQKITT